LYVAIPLTVGGTLMVCLAVYIAFTFFYSYRVLPVGGASIEEAISSLVNALVEIAVRLGFLGLVVWAGSVLLRHGIASLRLELRVESSKEE